MKLSYQFNDSKQAYAFLEHLESFKRTDNYINCGATCNVEECYGKLVTISFYGPHGRVADELEEFGITFEEEQDKRNKIRALKAVVNNIAKSILENKKDKGDDDQLRPA